MALRRAAEIAQWVHHRLQMELDARHPGHASPQAVRRQATAALLLVAAVILFYRTLFAIPQVTDASRAIDGASPAFVGTMSLVISGSLWTYGSSRQHLLVPLAGLLGPVVAIVNAAPHASSPPQVIAAHVAMWLILAATVMATLWAARKPGDQRRSALAASVSWLSLGLLATGSALADWTVSATNARWAIAFGAAVIGLATIPSALVYLTLSELTSHHERAEQVRTWIENRPGRFVAIVAGKVIALVCYVALLRYFSPGDWVLPHTWSGWLWAIVAAGFLLVVMRTHRRTVLVPDNALVVARLVSRAIGVAVGILLAVVLTTASSSQDRVGVIAGVAVVLAVTGVLVQRRHQAAMWEMVAAFGCALVVALILTLGWPPQGEPQANGAIPITVPVVALLLGASLLLFAVIAALRHRHRLNRHVGLFVGVSIVWIVLVSARGAAQGTIFALDVILTGFLVVLIVKQLRGSPSEISTTEIVALLLLFVVVVYLPQLISLPPFLAVRVGLAAFALPALVILWRHTRFDDTEQEPTRSAWLSAAAVLYAFVTIGAMLLGASFPTLLAGLAEVTGSYLAVPIVVLLVACLRSPRLPAAI